MSCIRSCADKVVHSASITLRRTSECARLTFNTTNSMRRFLIGSALVAIVLAVEASLLFPAASVLQLTASVSVPITDLPGMRRMNWDVGFQMNWQLPFELAAFYNAPIWPGLANGTTKRSISHNATIARGQLGLSSGPLRADYTTSEFYAALENALEGNGYHKSCLRRAICELALHPFAEDDYSFLIDILRFFLTPSHQLSLGHSEDLANYQRAEQHGHMGFECSTLITDCKEDILRIFTKVDINHQ